MKKTDRKKRIPTLLRVAALLSFCVLLAAGGICLWGLHENVFPADVAVVLGNEVYADGTPAPRLAARLDRAQNLYADGLCATLIVSGGVGRSGYDEAVAMRDYLVARGVPGSAVAVDSHGVNTRATARFVAEYLRARNQTSAIAVSQYFHLLRTESAFRAEGVPVVGRAYARYVEARDVFSVLREVPAVVFYFLGLR